MSRTPSAGLGRTNRASTFQEQLERLQTATDQHRHCRDTANRESAFFVKQIQDLKVKRQKLTLEKQGIQVKLAKFSNDEAWVAEQRERLIRQKEEDKQALVECARESEECENEANEEKESYCREMKKMTDEHEQMLRRMESARMKMLVCPETVDYLVSIIPKEGAQKDSSIPAISHRLKIASDHLKQATHERTQQKSINERLQKKVVAFRKQLLSSGYQGLTKDQLLRQEQLWAETTGAYSLHKDTGVPQDVQVHLDEFYGPDSDSMLTEATSVARRPTDEADHDPASEYPADLNAMESGESDVTYQNHTSMIH